MLTLLLALLLTAPPAPPAETAPGLPGSTPEARHRSPSFAACPPDDARTRDVLETFLTRQSATTVAVRAEAGLAGASAADVEAITDPAACAFVAANLRGDVDHPDYLYVFYRHAPTGRIITVRVVRRGIRGPDEHGDYEMLLSGPTVTVYAPNMVLLAGVNY